MTALRVAIVVIAVEVVVAVLAGAEPVAEGFISAPLRNCCAMVRRSMRWRCALRRRSGAPRQRPRSQPAST